MELGEKLNNLYCDDVRNLRVRFPEEGFVDVVITSPPYMDTLNYGPKNQIGYGQSKAQYLEEMQSVFRDCASVAKANAAMWLVVDSVRRNGVMEPLPFLLSEEARKAGWHLVEITIWDKGKTRPWSKRGQFRNRFEYILFLVRDPNRYNWNIADLREVALTEWWRDYPHRYSPQGKGPSNIWRHLIPNQGSWANVNYKHFCPFPVDMVHKMITLSSPRNWEQPPVVFDPFAGSGTVLAVAEQMGLRYLGFELNPVFQEQFHTHVRDDVAQAWAKVKSEFDRLHGIQLLLGDLIPKLRQTRYPKQLHMEWAKRLLKDYQEASGNTDYNWDPGFRVLAYLVRTGFRRNVATITDLDTSEVLGAMDLAVVVDNATRIDEIEKALSGLHGEKPLSKFGLNVMISVMTLEQLEQGGNWFSEGQLSVYEKGSTSNFSRSIDSSALTPDIRAIALQSSLNQWNPKRREYPAIYADFRVTSGECDQIPYAKPIKEQFMEVEVE